MISLGNGGFLEDKRKDEFTFLKVESGYGGHIYVLGNTNTPKRVIRKMILE